MPTLGSVSGDSWSQSHKYVLSSLLAVQLDDIFDTYRHFLCGRPTIAYIHQTPIRIVSVNWTQSNLRMSRPTNEIEDRLDELNELRESVRSETIEQLGTKAALRIHNIHAQNWIDVAKWIAEDRDSPADDILLLYFGQLFNKLQWMQFLFLRGSYGAVHWHARVALEGVAMAHSVSHRGANLKVDEQMTQATEIEDEETAREWIESTLRHVLDYDDDDVTNWMDEWWVLVNKNVHASPQRIAANTRDAGTGVLMTDAFDQTLATEAIATVDEVMDIIWAVLLSQFPNLASKAADSEYFPTNEQEAPHVAYVV